MTDCPYWAPNVATEEHSRRQEDTPLIPQPSKLRQRHVAHLLLEWNFQQVLQHIQNEQWSVKVPVTSFPCCHQGLEQRQGVAEKIAVRPPIM